MHRPSTGRSGRALAIALAIALAVHARPAAAANSTVPGTITTYTTIENAGFEWHITGDDNANCTVTTEYRKVGEATWKRGQPLWRVETGLWHHGEDPGDLLAGSLFSLQPGATYDVRLTLSDPDGGAAQQIVTVTTRTELQASPTARVRYVKPGSGGGTGTQSDPFRGLAAADAAASAGDVFVLLPGTYTGKFTPTRNGTATAPIVYRGSDLATVILDGGGGTSGGSNCVDLSNRQYVILEWMTLQNCLRVVAVGGSKGCVVRSCTFDPIRTVVSAVGVYGMDAHDLLVSDCVFDMSGDWAGVGRTGTYGTGGYGVRVTGDGIVLCWNHVTEAWDGLDIGDSDGTGARTFNCDIYGNFIERTSDDATQTDAVHANIRVYRNRMLNSGCATSCQPAFGGPVYIFRNEIDNVRMEPFKFHQETSYFGTADPQETSGMLIWHNTVIGSKSGWYETGYWHHVQMRNNLLLGARVNYAMYIPNGQRGDLDYDGFNRQQSYLVKYNGTAFSTLFDLFTGKGLERSGREVRLAEFQRAAWPSHPEWDWTSGYGTPTAPNADDLTLRLTSLALDRGVRLANVNDDVTGIAPDLGCYEYARPVPVYGPRAWAMFVSASPLGGQLELATTASPGLRLAIAGPSPSRDGVTLSLAGVGDGSAVDVRVIDVLGRSVRRLGAEGTGAMRTVRWDTRDEAGAPVANGVYFVLARTGADTRTLKVSVLH